LYSLSEKLLGTLYRSVDILKLLNEWDIKVGENKNGPWKAWEEIKVKLERVWSHVFKDSYIEDTTRMFAAYMAELQYIEHAFCLVT